MRILLPICLGLAVAGCSCGKTEPPVAKPTPVRSESAEQVAVKMEVPLYPGAKPATPAGSPPHKDDTGKMRYEMITTTPDSVDSVVDFYKAKIKLDSVTKGNGRRLMGSTSIKHNLVIIDVVPQAGVTFIEVKAIVG